MQYGLMARIAVTDSKSGFYRPCSAAIEWGHGVVKTISTIRARSAYVVLGLVALSPSLRRA